MNYALITGASSGIGYQLAVLFAKKKHNLVLVSRNENNLNEIATDLKNRFKIDTINIPIDLSNPQAADRIYKILNEKSIKIKYLVNNAGFYVKGRFAKTSWKMEEELIQLQCITHTKLTKLFLPDMLNNGLGGILNIGSTGSFVPGPYNAIYCAVKSYVLSFSEALAEELSGTGIHVTALCPGGTKTNFQDFENYRSMLFTIMDASKVAQVGYDALMKGKRIVVPGLMNRIQVFLVRFLPRKFVTKITAQLIPH